MEPTNTQRLEAAFPPLPTYGLEFDPSGDESDSTNIGIENALEMGPRNIDGWYQLQDDNGIKAYFANEALATFVQRVIDPTRWKYLTEDDKNLLRLAVIG